jgi:hypothetical protein
MLYERKNVLYCVQNTRYVISILWKVMKAELTVNGVNLPLRPTSEVTVLRQAFIKVTVYLV